MNHPELAALWGEDETIGWIYQYWNSQEERKAMRDASAAPRNSRELAVRNQFFTPRYVVQFLSENTLGRTWYEMTQGQTALKENCTYLVAAPAKCFLQANEAAPEAEEQSADLPQAEQLKLPVYIPYRPLKDPREIRLLDPACGSMHFGLYAFDLFETIYSEAWDLNVATLREDFPTKEALLLEMPRLIIEHNIHGVDIDPRATQIAGLACGSVRSALGKIKVYLQRSPQGEALQHRLRRAHAGRPRSARRVYRQAPPRHCADGALIF